ncbi:hypothetical protein ACOMHN_041138 [Nucella lapillus]
MPVSHEKLNKLFCCHVFSDVNIINNSWRSTKRIVDRHIFVYYRSSRQQTMEFTEDMTEDTWSFSTTMFNPLQSYLVPLAMFRDPSMTPYEVEVSGYSQATAGQQQRPSEAEGLLAMMEQFAKATHTDKWVTALEAVAPLLNKGLSYLLHVDKKKRVVDTLVEWTLEGLSEERAMSQPEAPFKVRHLKMGIHLATALLTCEPSLTMVLLAAGVQSKLVDLLESRFMAFSVRLLIVTALDASLRFANGVRWFLGSHPQQTHGKFKDELSAYQRIVQLMSRKQLAQVMMAMNGLLRKAHTYETFMKLRAAIDHVLDSLPSVEEEEGGGKGVGGGAGGEEGEDMDQGESTLPVEEEDVDTIVACLDEIYHLLVLPHHLISQPKSLLPVKSLSEKSGMKAAEIYPSLFRLAYHCRLLECLFVLLATGATASQAAIFVATRRIIHILLQSQEGLLFFSTRLDTTNGIIRSLVQMTDDSCGEEGGGEDMVARQLGLEMVFHLHTLQHVDLLLEYLKKVGEVIPVDDAEPLGILHSLYSMTFTSGLRDCVMGRRAIAHVMGLANNLSALLPFIQSSGDEARDAAQRKSVCWGYGSQLILMIMAHAEGTNIVEKFGTRLLTISENSGSSSRLCQLQDWLAPVKKLTTLGVEEVGVMAGLLNTYAEDVSKKPPALVTLMRVLHSLAVPPAYLTALDDEYPAPLHHNYIVVELYSADCFPVFVTILQKLSEAQLKPWQQGLPQSLDHWSLFFAIITPTIAIVKATISLIIQARGSQFKDMTVLSTLLELHTVVCSVPSSTLYHAGTLKVQKDIVDTLLAFTQPDFKTQGEEALSSSMWTVMMKEVIRYAVKSPYVYMSGLLLISELVPLPFPLLAKEPLETEEISLAVNTRKLWSAHLHPLMPDIHSLISLLAGTGCQPLLCLLRRVCWQIADLAAPSATIIAKCLLDVYLEQRAAEQSLEEEKKEDEKEKDGGKEEGEGGGSVSPMTTKILSLISYLLSQPGIKSAILQLISAGSSEEKYKSLLTSLVQTMNQVSSRPQHVQAQEAIVSVLQSLCDQEITLVAQDTNMSLPEQLACTLPDKDLMGQMVGALMEHIGGTPPHSYASLLPSVRTLVMLTEHDYGFYHLKVGLESVAGVLVSVLRHINSTFSKDSSDALSTLSTILELLRLLTTTDPPEEGLPLTRTRTLSPQQLARILDWAPNRHHPLQDLEAMAKEEESLESLSESISMVMALLHDSASHTFSGHDQWEVALPPSVSLRELFAQRSVYTLTDSDDDRLSANCWLANPALEEPDAEPEVIKCDLLAWCKRYLPDLDIEEELKKETEDRQEDIVRPKRIKDRRKSQEVININRGRPGKKPFVAPMRGRGIMQQGMVQRGGHDLFRSRPPNTSRPPSMHVDDFVKMENTRNQMQPPLQPTPPGPVLQRRDKGDIPRGRGRGVMDRGGRGGFSSRGPFFTPPANYPRRDSSPHGGHNLHMFATPPMMGSHRPKQNFPAPRQFPHEAGFDPSSRGGALWTVKLKAPPVSGTAGAFKLGARHEPHPVGGLLDRHDVRDNRFAPRGGRGAWFGGQSKDMGPGRFLMRGGGGGGGFHGRREPDRHQRSFTK